MPVNSQDIIELLCTLSQEENLKVTLKESLKGGIIVGIAAAVGGMTMGPIGLAVGGTVGGCLAAYASHSKFMPAAQVIATMREDKREFLAHKVQNIMSSVDVQDIAIFAAMVAGDLAVRQRVVEALCDYIRTELSMAIVD